MPVSYKPNDLVKDYIIDEYLSEGNFARSYKARKDELEIFLKQYIDPTPISPEYKPFLEHQQKVRMILDQLSIVEKNYEFFEFEGCYFQAKEFMKGKDLSSLLNTENITDWQRILIAIVFMYAISSIHEKKIVHTDLKPEQIYLQRDPSIKLQYRVCLVDFDFCRLPGISEPYTIVTSPFYSSPEHIRNMVPDYASDIFTCGLILFEILAGRPPLDADNEEDYVEAVLHGNYHTLRGLNSEISDKLSTLVSSMLKLESSLRPTANEMHEVLLKEKGAFESRSHVSSPSEQKEISPGIESPKKTGTPSEPETITKKKSVPVRLKLSTPTYSASVHKNMTIGRAWLKPYGKFYKCAENEQFEIIKRDDGWYIKGFPSENPTIVGDKDATSKEITLEDGIVIQIDALSLKVKFIY